MGSLRNAAVAAVLLCLCGCMGPEMMIVSSIAQVALKTGIRYAEKNKPTPEQAWRRDRFQHVVNQAAAGDVDAQFALSLYFQVHEKAAAERWTCLAANQGDARAQMQMGHWYNEDRLEEDLWPYIGLSPDNVRAYEWYRAAHAVGDPLGGALSEQVSASLSESEIAAAERRLNAGELKGCRFFATHHGGATPQPVIR